MDVPVTLHLDPEYREAKLTLNIVVTVSRDATAPTQQAILPELLTIRQATALASISRTVMHGFVASGGLPSVKIGKRGIRIRRKDLMDWMNRLPPGARWG